MSFVSADEIGSLRIKRMILHVVGSETEFEPQPEMSDIEQEGFFLARITDMAADSVHEFEEKSETKSLLQLLANDAMSFVEAGQTLARRFSKDHVGSSRDGAFFMFELGCDDNQTKLYSLIKYDYRQAIELYEKQGRNALRRIIQAFIQEKRAIQKCCLIRVSAGVVDARVSAQDRMGKAPDLTDYFAKFLEVVRNRTDQELNRDLNEAIRAALERCSDQLPEGGPAKALQVARAHLRGRELIDDEAIREAIFVAAGRPEDEDVKAQIQRVTDREMKNKRLSGVAFAPDPQILRLAPRRLIRTAEGVEVTFPGSQEDHAVKTTVEDGVTTITIKTAETLVANGTLAYKASDEARLVA